MTDSHHHPSPSPGRLQFSLRTMLIIMTGFAATLSGVFAGPDWMRMITAVFFTTAVTIVLVVVLVYGRGYQRTFCIGALFPSGLVTYQIGGSAFMRATYGMGPDEMTELLAAIFLLAYCLVVLCGGLLAMGVRWMVESSHRDSPAAECPVPVGSPFAESDDGLPPTG